MSRDSSSLASGVAAQMPPPPHEQSKLTSKTALSRVSTNHGGQRMLIDIHAHIIPEHFPPAASRASSARWPSMDHFEAGQSRVMIAGENFRTVHTGNWDVERRLADMDDAEVTAQAIS